MKTWTQWFFSFSAFCPTCSLYLMRAITSKLTLEWIKKCIKVILVFPDKFVKWTYVSASSFQLVHCTLTMKLAHSQILCSQPTITESMIWESSLNGHNSVQAYKLPSVKYLTIASVIYHNKDINQRAAMALCSVWGKFKTSWATANAQAYTD